eukprot:TRINITY_DN111452_c0_g1_i1.p1 TRINITY_DN111452_c0_g1~~TRINITY_DN111452_c0_g1_i1.p1  ORF type:complete len:208 (+),score=60.82 TRINITY_DN111452_c0_g1_i1:99-722(+)
MLSTKCIVTVCLMLCTPVGAMIQPSRKDAADSSFRSIAHDSKMAPDYSAPKRGQIRVPPPPEVKSANSAEKKSEKEKKKSTPKTEPPPMEPHKIDADYMKDDAPGKKPVPGVNSDGSKRGVKKASGDASKAPGTEKGDNQPLPSQGYKGSAVRHEDGETMTSDWRAEVPEYERPKSQPPRSGASLTSLAVPALVAFLSSTSALHTSF